MKNMVQQYFAWKEGERILWPPELDAKILTIPVSPQTITNFRLIIGPSRIDELKLSPEIPLPPQIASLEGEFLSWNLNALSMITVEKKIKRFRTPIYSMGIYFPWGDEKRMVGEFKDLSAETYSKIKTVLSTSSSLLGALIGKGEYENLRIFTTMLKLMLFIYISFFIIGLKGIIQLSCPGIYYLIATTTGFISIAFSFRLSQKILVQNLEILIISFLFFFFITFIGIFAIFLC